MFVKKIKMKNNFKNLKNLPSNTNLKENFNYKKEIEKSLDDIKKGRVTSQDDLLIEISKWS